MLKGPNANREPKQIEILLGAGTDASASDALIRAVAVGRQFYVTKSDAPSKYVQRPFTGDFAGALASLFGRGGGLFEPVQIAMRSGKEIAGWLEALRFNLLGPLRITGFARGRNHGGQTFDRIHFTAENGRLEVRSNHRTHFLSSVHLWVEPPGSSGKVLVEIIGELSQEVVRDPSGLVAFDPSSRHAVADVKDLDSNSLPTGKPAPAFALESTAGRRIASADLNQGVVILDFWATWCVPCWQVLRETQELADWAVAAKLSVTILAINTMEEAPNAEQRKGRVVDFFKSQGLSMTCLLDQDAQVFKSFGSPGLPSIVVVAPGGRIAKYYVGAVSNLSATLKDEVKALAATSQR